MASPQVYDAIRDFLDANYSATPVVYENEGGAPNSDFWTLVEFTAATFSQVSIGAGSQAENRWDEEGQFFAHVMVRIGTGVRDALSFGWIIADLFRGLRLMNDRLEFDDVVVGYGSSQDDGIWYRVSVNVGWRLMDSRR